MDRSKEVLQALARLFLAKSRSATIKSAEFRARNNNRMSKECVDRASVWQEAGDQCEALAHEKLPVFEALAIIERMTEIESKG